MNVAQLRAFLEHANLPDDTMVTIRRPRRVDGELIYRPARNAIAIQSATGDAIPALIIVEE